MNNGFSILRLFICYFFCVFFLVFSFFDIDINNTVQSEEVENLTVNSSKQTSKEIENSSESESNDLKKEKNNSSKNNESKAVSAAAIKGKITTKYISPYKSSLSYDKVYLKNSTSLDINLKNLLNKKLKFKIEQNEKPQVLIMHTHTTESFMTEDTDYYTEEFKTRSTDNSKNMVKLGSVIAEKLNQTGIKTLHDKTKHDYPEYTGSYGRSAKTVNKYLKKYPSIKVVLDLHRDSISTEDGKAKLITEINGKKAAQIMIVMGSQSGSVTDYPNWRENLSLAVKLHQKTEQKYPTLARPILLRSAKYNQSLSNGSMLIEIGTEANTLEEVCYSAQLLANALSETFKTLE